MSEVWGGLFSGKLFFLGGGGLFIGILIYILMFNLFDAKIKLHLAVNGVSRFH